MVYIGKAMMVRRAGAEVDLCDACGGTGGRIAAMVELIGQ